MNISSQKQIDDKMTNDELIEWVDEWFPSIIAIKIIDNIKNVNMLLNYPRLNYNASNIILDAFNWNDSNEGEKYWKDMYYLLEAMERTEIEKNRNYLDTTYTTYTKEFKDKVKFELLGRNYSI